MADKETVPLFVDLDNCLIQTDLLHESMVLLLRQPGNLLRLPLWLLKTRNSLKQRLVERGTPSVELLPYNQPLIEFLRGESLRGRPLILATATHEKIAQAVAKHLGLFDFILATNERRNLKGVTKLAVIEDLCGERGWKKFAYVGDSKADLPIWAVAAETYVANPTRGLLRRVTRKPAAVFKRSQRRWPRILAAMRPYQWTKNLLVFVPLVAAHSLGLAAITAALLAFFAFSLTASAVYLFNDILDVEHDRRHPTKRLRPIASGELSMLGGAFLAITLMGVASGLSGALLPLPFTAALVGYAAMSFAYSLWLKRKLLADVMMLALLYTIRVIAGGLAIPVEISHWLAMLSVFLFMSLAFAKRDSELRRNALEGSKHMPGRGYQPADMPIIQNIGVTCGCLAVLVLAMYIQSDRVMSLYPQPHALWIVCLAIMYWVARIWFLAARAKLPEDPIVFALRDRVSYGVALICAMAIALASW